MLTTAPRTENVTPPTEEFWKRYSPHHEFPLSSITSVTVHVLVVVLLLLGAWVAVRMGLADENKKIPVTPIKILENGEGTANGILGKKGVGDGPLTEEVGDNPEPPRSTKPIELMDLPESNLDPINLPNYKDKEGKRIIDPGAKNPVLEALHQLDEEARIKLFSGVGGKGRPNGSGTSGSTKGNNLSKRQKRLLRWTMIFNTRDGNDYAAQLDALGAILAVPSPGGKEYLLIRDLKGRPAQGKVEDLASIQSIYWIDDKPDSVAGLAWALGINPPKHIVAFFPAELENKLAELERAYKGLKEDDIAETRFDIIRGASGYEPKVTFQSAKR
jgi:hypothetical protein